MAKAPPKTPASLGDAGKAYWQTVITEFAIEAHHVDLLTAACMQLDRAASAREIIATEGVTCKDRFGQPKVHPAVDAERNAHTTFLRLSRELGLDITPPQAPRGPRRAGTRE